MPPPPRGPSCRCAAGRQTVAETTHELTGRGTYTAGERISSAGSFGLADIVEEPRNQLDFVLVVPVKPFGIPLTLKAAAENLLDDTILYTQAGRVQRTYTQGIKASLGLAYTFN